MGGLLRILKSTNSHLGRHYSGITSAGLWRRLQQQQQQQPIRESGKGASAALVISGTPTTDHDTYYRGQRVQCPLFARAGQREKVRDCKTWKLWRLCLTTVAWEGVDDEYYSGQLFIFNFLAASVESLNCQKQSTTVGGRREKRQNIKEFPS